MIKLIKELLDPTAASASFPIKFPAMTESAVLYSCWNKFPIKSGIENSIILLIILPSVIVIFFSLFLFSILSPLLLFYVYSQKLLAQRKKPANCRFPLKFCKILFMYSFSLLLWMELFYLSHYSFIQQYYSSYQFYLLQYLVL